MVGRSKNLETSVLIRMQRPRARLGTNRRPPSRIDHARPYAAFHFDFRSAERTLGFSRRENLTAKCERFPSMDGGIAGREGEGGFAHLLRRPASRCVTLRYVRVTDLFRIVSKNK